MRALKVFPKQGEGYLYNFLILVYPLLYSGFKYALDYVVWYRPVVNMCEKTVVVHTTGNDVTRIALTAELKREDSNAKTIRCASRDV